MQVSLSTGRIVRQYGVSPGELEGCTIEDVSERTMAAILAALGQVQGDGGVVLSPDHHTVSVQAPSQGWIDASQAQQQALVGAAQQRADAVQTVLNAPEISANPALAAALAHILGADQQQEQGA